MDGLRFSRFLSDRTSDEAEPFLTDSLRAVLDEHGLTGEDRTSAGNAIGVVLRSMFYSSSPDQRLLMQRMSRAYVIAFALKSEPRVLRYFDDLLAETHLYVGTDVLVNALSERYVPTEDQHTRNLLRAASAAGARLILTAPVLDELCAHIRLADDEYRNYSHVLDRIESYEIARQQPKILVRAFLYTQIEKDPGRPRSWMQFVNQFCIYSDLHKQDATRQMRRYLVSQFGLEYESRNDVNSISDHTRHSSLKASLRDLKGSESQAATDAYVYELVMHRRATRNEGARSVEYGFQTWWLSSGERSAVRAMSRLDRHSDPVLMQPAFLSKYIQFAPSADQARQSLGEFVPSLLGIRLGRRVAEHDFHKLIETMEEAESLEPGGRAARMAELADRLKSVTHKEFGRDFDSTQESLSIDSHYRHR